MQRPWRSLRSPSALVNIIVSFATAIKHVIPTRPNFLPLNRVSLAVSFASTDVHMRHIVWYFCVVIGSAIHKVAVADRLVFIAKSSAAVEHLRRMLRRWVAMVTTIRCCRCCNQYLSITCNNSITTRLTADWLTL